jgi:hypothetical protein
MRHMVGVLIQDVGDDEVVFEISMRLKNPLEM